MRYTHQALLELLFILNQINNYCLELHPRDFTKGFKPVNGSNARFTRAPFESSIARLIIFDRTSLSSSSLHFQSVFGGAPKYGVFFSSTNGHERSQTLPGKHQAHFDMYIQSVHRVYDEHGFPLSRGGSDRSRLELAATTRTTRINIFRYIFIRSSSLSFINSIVHQLHSDEDY